MISRITEKNFTLWMQVGQGIAEITNLDVAELGTRISHLNMIDYADGMYLFYVRTFEISLTFQGSS